MLTLTGRVPQATIEKGERLTGVADALLRNAVYDVLNKVIAVLGGAAGACPPALSASKP